MRRSLNILVQFVWGGPGRYIQMWQSKREISRECNNIIGSAKGSQISEKYWGEVGKGKRADVYLEERKRRGHIFSKWNKCLCRKCLISTVQSDTFSGDSTWHLLKICLCKWPAITYHLSIITFFKDK